MIVFERLDLFSVIPAFGRFFKSKNMRQETENEFKRKSRKSFRICKTSLAGGRREC
jgi:hypothetical protein